MKIKPLVVDDYLKQCDSDGKVPFYDKLNIIADIVPAFISVDSFQNTLKMVMSSSYGDYRLRLRYYDDAGKIDYARLTSDIMSWYAANAYTYEGLLISTQETYDPLENYHITHDGSSNEKGTDDRTLNYGKQRSQTEEGERADREHLGDYNDTHTGSVSPFDTDSFQNRDRTQSDFGSKDNNYTKGSMSTVESIDEHADDDLLERDMTRKDTYVRHGRIGTVSAQTLISEQRDVLDFSIYLKIAKEIMQIICLRYLGRGGIECDGYILSNDK